MERHLYHSPAAWRRAAADVGQWTLLIALLAFYVQLAAIQAAHPYGTDYAKFYYSAYQALHGQPLYTVMDAALFNVPAAVFYQSPLVQNPSVHLPQVTAAYMPLALLPFPISYWLWTVLSIAAGLGSCAIWWRVLYGPQANWRVLLWMWIGLLAFYPTFTALRLGQATMVLLLLLTVGWQQARSGRSKWAGVAIGLAIILRTFAALLLFYFLLKRQWRMLLWSAGTFAATVVLSLPFVGVDAYGQWLAVTGGIDWQARNWNASLAGFFARLLPPQWGPAALLATAACSLFWLALLTWLSWPQPQAQPQPDRRRDDLTFSLALALMLLLSPLGWMYYFPILLIGVFVIWRQTADGSLRALCWVLLPVWLLSNVPTEQHLAAELTDPLGWWTWNSVYFYALIIFCGLLAYLAGRGERVTKCLRNTSSPAHLVTRSDQTPPPR